MDTNIRWTDLTPSNFVKHYAEKTLKRVVLLSNNY